MAFLVKKSEFLRRTIKKLMAGVTAKCTGMILISGGAAGIGRAIAESFLSAGAKVHVCDSSAENLDAFLAANTGATATLADISNPVKVDQVFSDLRDRGNGLDILINNAGIAGPTAGVEDVSIEDWDRCIAVDLNGLFYMTRQAVPMLKQNQGGSIINIASGAALFGCPLRSPYVASKWAVIGLTKTWAMELGPDNIRVNAICPGSVAGERIDAVIERDATERGLSTDEIRDVYLRQSSMRTFVSPEDVASTALFLATDTGAKISGQSIAVDGHTESLSNWLD
jgi:NAD(P)-dependent dehydrogenase (short-subunit alcohol dehydrogenase family)